MDTWSVEKNASFRELHLLNIPWWLTVKNPPAIQET